jgi:thioredoxin 1
MHMFKTVAIAASAIAAFAAPALAAENKPFDKATFDAAQTAGRPILVHVHAWWCPVCASQAKTINEAVAASAYANTLVLRLNYDKQKADWQALNVQKQSTLIAFRGPRELGRIAYVTDKAKVREIVALTAAR